MKRIISLILCICLLFTLFACSSNQQDANETTTDNNTLNEATTAPVLQLNDYSVGNTVVLGQYEQDNNTSNGTEPIEWDVLAVENGKALLLSKHMLERKLYHDSLEEVTWETCSLRKWLNNDFYDAAFSRQEKDQICSVNNKNQDNLKYGTDGGNTTNDNVFLLSTDEVDKYLDWSEVVNSGSYTAYLRAKSEINAAGNYTGWWWLRSAGQNQYFVLYCGTPDHDYEDIRYMGLDVMNSFANIRPAIWVSFDGKSTAENDKEPQNNSVNASVKTSVSVGDLVYFGTYEQDNQNITKNEQIEWRILDIEDGKALLLSTYILDSMGFNSEYKSVTWENSTIRAWLNNDFYNAAFTNEEQSAIVKSQIINPNNPTWGTNGGNPTTDSVFLLSIQEAEKYFPNDDQNIITTATNYAYQQGCFMYEEYRTYNGISYKQYCSWTVEPDPYPGLDGTFAYWWLRTPGEITTGNYGDIRIAYVKADDYPITHRGESIRTTLGVRPAIWIDLMLLSDSDLAKHEVTNDEKLAIEAANAEKINELISEISKGADYSAYAELYSLTSSLKSGEKTLLDGKWCRKDGSFVGFSSPTAEDIAISLRCYNGMYQAQLNERARFINSSAAMLEIEASDGMAYILFVYDPAGAVRVYSLAGFGNGIEIPGVFIPERQYWDAYYSGNWPSIIDSDSNVGDTSTHETIDFSKCEVKGSAIMKQYEGIEDTWGCFKVYDITNANEVYFEVEWYRATGFGGVAKLKDGTATFDIQYGETKLKGNFTIADDAVVLNLEESTLMVGSGVYKYKYDTEVYRDSTLAGYGTLDHNLFVSYLKENNESTDITWEFLGSPYEIFFVTGAEYPGSFDLYKVTVPNGTEKYYACLPYDYQAEYGVYQIGLNGTLQFIWKP